MLDADVAQHIQRFVSIFVAVRMPDGRPALALASGCRLDADARRLTLLLAEREVVPIRPAIQQGATLAAVFSRPSTHRTVQIKGGEAQFEALLTGDLDLIADQRASFAADLVSIGYSEEFASLRIPDPGPNPVALTFTVTAVFEQTPGPNAGVRLV